MLDPKGKAVLLHHRPQAKYMNPYWDLPAMGPSLRGVPMFHGVYKDRFTGQPLFSTDDQVLVTNRCVGDLQFLRPLDPGALVHVGRVHHGGGVDVWTPQRHWVITKHALDQCSRLGPEGSIVKVGLHVGGSGPGGPEVKTSPAYAHYGPHYLGRYVDGMYCIQPSALDPDFVFKYERPSTIESGHGYMPEGQNMMLVGRPVNML
jgi:hypothetical protein